MPGSPVYSLKLVGHVFSVSGSQANIRLTAPVGSELPDQRRITVGKFLACARCDPRWSASSPRSTAGQKPAGEAGIAIDRPRRPARRDQGGDKGGSVLPARRHRVSRDRRRGRSAWQRRLATRSTTRPAPTRSTSASCSRTARSAPTSMSTTCCASISPSSARTGVGKSSGVAVILRQILEARPDLRIFLIDPHNEYGHCFGDRAQVLNPEEPQAAVLAVQFRGDLSTSSSAAGRAWRRKSRSSPR